MQAETLGGYAIIDYLATLIKKLHYDKNIAKLELDTIVVGGGLLLR